MTDLSKLAVSLSVQQRGAILRAEIDGHLGNRFVRRWHANGRTLRSIRKKGLGMTVWSGIMLTPLGLSVFAHLKENDRG